ncbi:MAG: BLUF domain-containing protein [Jatrophihabitantaceae bacterium]
MAEPETDPIFQLIYRSTDAIAPADRRHELGTLFTRARSNNKEKHITGALLVANNHFVQTLEGEEVAVRELFEHIRVDPRHQEVVVIESRTVTSRVFARWSMAKVSEGADDADINLIAHADGIAEAAQRGVATPGQADLLQLMRDAALGHTTVE